jgi:hypothetical protein
VSIGAVSLLGEVMDWTFKILAALNGLLILVLFFYKASGEDPAGEGMRLGVATIMLFAYAAILAGYWLIKWKLLRVVLLILLALPIIITVYGVMLMLG